MGAVEGKAWQFVFSCDGGAVNVIVVCTMERKRCASCGTPVVQAYLEKHVRSRAWNLEGGRGDFGLFQAPGSRLR